VPETNHALVDLECRLLAVGSTGRRNTLIF